MPVNRLTACCDMWDTWGVRVQGKARCVQRVHTCTENVSIMLPDVTKLSCCSLETTSTGPRATSGVASGANVDGVQSAGEDSSAGDTGQARMTADGHLSSTTAGGVGDERRAVQVQAGDNAAAQLPVIPSAPPSTGVNVDNKLEWHGKSFFVHLPSVISVCSSKSPGIIINHLHCSYFHVNISKGPCGVDAV